MREAVGGSILFYIILMFIGIFIVFIAIIMNYASAYRVSNRVVDMIIETEGKVAFNDNTTSSLVGFLESNNYYNGLRVECSQPSGVDNSVFSVTTYINFYIPIIDAGFPIPIKNESKTLYKVKCSDTAYSDNACWSGSIKGIC